MRGGRSIDKNRLAILVTNASGYPIRGNRVLSGIEVAGSATSVVLFVGAVCGLFGDGPLWSTVLVCWLLMISSALIALVVIQERRVARRVRYAVAAEAIHGAAHLIRDAEAGILNDQASTSVTVPLVRDALTEVARAFTLITGSPCRACLKEVHYPQHTAISISADTLRELRVSTLCRDGAGGPPSPADERDHFVSDNTDFEVLFMKRWKHRWFVSNDLTQETNYKNSSWSDDRPHDYAATCVWPVQKTDDTEAGVHDTLGFLCIDTLDVDVFDERFDFHVGAAVADSFYPLLKLMAMSSEGVRFSADESQEDSTSPTDRR